MSVCVFDSERKTLIVDDDDHQILGLWNAIIWKTYIYNTSILAISGAVRIGGSRGICDVYQISFRLYKLKGLVQ